MTPHKQIDSGRGDFLLLSLKSQSQNKISCETWSTAMSIARKLATMFFYKLVRKVAEADV